ncbi:ATP synthase CF1 epsilon subunit, partial [Tanacetum coccineum]
NSEWVQKKPVATNGNDGALMGGFARIGNNEISVLVNDAERSGDIDPPGAQQALEVAEAALRKVEGKR